jgi:crotonobetainyl-CoA:carnitine CoA-transferase CaiB-like acyl-CoA transferase
LRPARSRRARAPYETFTTRDGDIVIAVGNDQTWQKFCPAIGLPQLASDPRFSTNKDRMEHYDAMRPPLDAAFRTKTSAEWIAILNKAGVANGEVRNIGQMLTDPQLDAREMIKTLMHPTAGATKVIGAPIKLSETAAEVRTPPPTLGQHTDAVLTELGYDSAAIAALRARKAI